MLIHVTDTIVLDENEINERFVRAKGPGGQNADLDATAVELRVDIGRSSLPPDVKERLITVAGRHVTSEGMLVIVSRGSRSQPENRESARARLLTLLKRVATPAKKRKATKPSRAARKERLVLKERHSAVKRSRSGRDDD